MPPVLQKTLRKREKYFQYSFDMDILCILSNLHSNHSLQLQLQ